MLEAVVPGAAHGDRAARGEDAVVVTGNCVALDRDGQRAGVAQVHTGGLGVPLGRAQVVDADPVAGDHVAGQVHARRVGVHVEPGVPVAVEHVPAHHVVEHAAGGPGQDHPAARRGGRGRRWAQPVVVGHVPGHQGVVDAVPGVVGQGDAAAAGVVVGHVAADHVGGGRSAEVVGDVDPHAVAGGPVARRHRVRGAVDVDAGARVVLGGVPGDADVVGGGHGPVDQAGGDDPVGQQAAHAGSAHGQAGDRHVGRGRAHPVGLAGGVDGG